MSVRLLQQQSVETLKSVETRSRLGIAGKEDIEMLYKTISELEKKK